MALTLNPPTFPRLPQPKVSGGRSWLFSMSVRMYGHDGVPASEGGWTTVHFTVYIYACVSMDMYSMYEGREGERCLSLFMGYFPLSPPPTKGKNIWRSMEQQGLLITKGFTPGYSPVSSSMACWKIHEKHHIHTIDDFLGYKPPFENMFPYVRMISPFKPAYL